MGKCLLPEQTGCYQTIRLPSSRHHLIRWAQLLATDTPVTVRTAATFRRRLLALDAIA